MAGLERIDTGSITIGDRLVDDGKTAVHAQHRGVGYVPQDGALFPHLTVTGNIGFGLPRRARSAAALSELIDLVELKGLERRYPHQLSGGQQQRVALARALAIQPKVVLLDEPFSSLDASLRASIRADIIGILKRTATTTVIVTHDQDEALSVADQIAVLEDGRIVACDDPRTLYRQPPDAAAATYLGDANIVAAKIEAGAASCALGRVQLVDPETPAEGASQLLVRPEQILVHRGPIAGATHATITTFGYHGHDALASLVLDQPGKEALLARVPGEQDLEPGQEVWVSVDGPVRAWTAPTPNGA
jgi:iron(III) transport system ATP-binding protein